MRANVITQCRQWFMVSSFSLLFALLALVCAQGGSPAYAQQTGPDASRAEAALATLRAHWDSEVITGVMVDEIKKVLDVGSSEDIEPLLARLELLKEAGSVYAPDFALWWDVRGRNEIGGKLFWKRDLLREAIATSLQGHYQFEAIRMFQEAAATGDPVARMWQSFAEVEMLGRRDPVRLGNVVALAEEARGLAETGDGDAAYFLGLLAVEGDRDLVSSSPEELVRWLEMAAEAGYEHAALLLAETYGRGDHGIPRDRVKAQEWSAKVQGANPRKHAANLRASSANNLKQMGLVGKMFANESRGEKWPLLSPERGQLAMDASAIYPEYLTDVRVYISPAHPDYYDLADIAESDPPAAIRDHSYWYLGYAITDETQGLEFVKLFREAADAGETLTDDIEAPALELGKVFQLREGIERFLITDINDPAASAKAQSQLPIMIERPGMHEAGANVLYLDGHVEFITYPGKFPMTEKFIQALVSLDDLKS